MRMHAAPLAAAAASVLLVAAVIAWPLPDPTSGDSQALSAVRVQAAERHRQLMPTQPEQWRGDEAAHAAAYPRPSRR